MSRLPESPTREEALRFISEASVYGNLGAFIGAGFSKAVLNDDHTVIALSWGELLEKASGKLDVNYKDIWKEGVGFPDVASAICSQHSIKTGCTFSKSLSY